MAKWFYYNEQGDKVEVTGGLLKGLAKAGVITPDTIVETEEGKTAPARKVKGLVFATSMQPETIASESATPKTEIYGLSQTNPPVAVNTSTTVVPEEVNPFDTIALHTDESAIVFPVPEEVNPFAAEPVVEENPFASATIPFTQPTQTASATPLTNVFCTNCGNVVSEQAVACLSCGARPTGHKKFCRQCGVGMNPEQVMCIKCGWAISTGYQDTIKKVKRLAQSVMSSQGIEKIKKNPKPVIIGGGVAAIGILCIMLSLGVFSSDCPITVVKQFYATVQRIDPSGDADANARLIMPLVTAEFFRVAFFRNEPDDLSLGDEIRNVRVSSHSRVINGNNATVTVLHINGREVRVRLVRLDWRITSID